MEVNKHLGCKGFLLVWYGIPSLLFIKDILDSSCMFAEGIQLWIKELIGVAMGFPGGCGIEVSSNGSGSDGACHEIFWQAKDVA